MLELMTLALVAVLALGSADTGFQQPTQGSTPATTTGEEAPPPPDDDARSHIVDIG